MLINLVLALAAVFLAARVVTLDRRALRPHRGSWVLLLTATVLYAALMAVEVVAGSRDERDLSWLPTLLETAVAVALVAGCYFLYVREHARTADAFADAETQRRRSQRLEAILALGDALRAARSEEEVASVATAAVERALSYRENAIYLLERETGMFRTVATRGADPEYDKVVRERVIPERVVRDVLKPEFRHGSVYFIDHERYRWTEEELHFFPPSELPDRGPGMFHADDALFAPLFDHEERMIGLFDLYDPTDGRVPADDALQLLEVFAAVTAAGVERVRYESGLERQAITDGLTNLYNHRYFQEALAREVERSLRYDQVFTLLMMDLDWFKTVNDRLGHPRGDEALRRVAGVLRENARAADLVARYGGEEFVMILPATTAGQAASLAERIADGVRRIVLDVADPPRLSISIGIAEFPGCGRDRESLIAAADTALLFAKRSGRDTIADFSQLPLVELDPTTLEGLAFRLEKADLETLETLAAAIGQRDAFAPSVRSGVAAGADLMADALALDAEQRDVLQAASLVYDIGKIGIPVEVLNREGRLSDEEMATVRRHPEVGKRLLESAIRLGMLLPVVLHHHERWDGTGYPHGLAGEDIPLAARVIAICDAWQAMLTDRPYRPALSVDAAVAELRAGAGTQFDPGLVEAFVAHVTGQAPVDG